MGRINILYQPRRNWGSQTEFQLNTNMSPAFENADNLDFNIKARFFYKSEFWEGENWTQLSAQKVKTCLRIKCSDAKKMFHGQAELGLSGSGVQFLVKEPATYLSLRGKYVGHGGLLRLQSGLSLFSRSSGTGRFYTYEPDVLYGMSLPVLSGSGSRVFILVQYQLLKSLRCELKLSRLDYDDRDEIGSGNNRILSNHRTGLKVQLVYRAVFND